MAMSENSRKVYDYVKSVDGQNITAADIAEATGLAPKSVNGVITAFQRHTKLVGEEKVADPLMERIPAEVENAYWTHTPVKLVRLTEAGKVFNAEA